MPEIAHCQHCAGNCDGSCVLPGGLCIHRPMPRRSAREWLLLMRTRRFWRSVLGVR